MKISDFLYSKDFDVNCNIEIYDCTDGFPWFEETPVYSGNLSKEVPDDVANMELSYITVNLNHLVIEGIKEKMDIHSVI